MSYLWCFFDANYTCIGADGTDWQGTPFRGKFCYRHLLPLPFGYSPIGYHYDIVIDLSNSLKYSRQRKGYGDDKYRTNYSDG